MFLFGVGDLLIHSQCGIHARGASEFWGAYEVFLLFVSLFDYCFPVFTHAVDSSVSTSFALLGLCFGVFLFL